MVELQTQHHEPELYSKGTIHLDGPLTASIVGVALEHQVALPFTDHSSTLHAISTGPARPTLGAVFASNEEVIPWAPCPIVTALTVLKYTATWMDNAGVTLVDGIAAAGHRVAHRLTLYGTFTADHFVLAAASAQHVPLWAWAVVVQIPVIVGPGCPLR